MSEWEVTLPITGIARLTVEADSEKDAIREAIDAVSFSDIDAWEAVKQISQGNVCYAMTPWEAEAEEVSE